MEMQMCDNRQQTKIFPLSGKHFRIGKSERKIIGRGCKKNNENDMEWKINIKSPSSMIYTIFLFLFSSQFNFHQQKKEEKKKIHKHNWIYEGFKSERKEMIFNFFSFLSINFLILGFLCIFFLIFQFHSPKTQERRKNFLY